MDTTKGTWRKSPHGVVTVSRRGITEGSKRICGYTNSFKPDKEVEANADLIVEAGNISNATGFMPNQLERHRTDLLKLLYDILGWDGILPHSRTRIAQVIDSVGREV